MVGITSDDDSYRSNYGQCKRSECCCCCWLNVRITTGTDIVNGTAKNDVFNAVRASSAGGTETYAPVIEVVAAPETDSIYIETDIATTNLSTQTGLEIIQINTRDAAYLTIQSLSQLIRLTPAFRLLILWPALHLLTLQMQPLQPVLSPLLTAKTSPWTTPPPLLGTSDTLAVTLSASDGDLLLLVERHQMP